MFDQLLSVFSRYFTASENANKQTVTEQYKTTVNNKRWMYCVILAKQGWEAYSCKTIATEETEAYYPSKERKTVVKWRKEGKKDITIVLSFAEQRLWLSHMMK